ncbi:MAG: 30S ribosomal protein S8 [Thermoproteota archaeon]|nr:MAG: 30S ribosomal protein S8 [Candidatus Korarchaeota archaeon]
MTRMDPLADALSTIQNAVALGKTECLITISSKLITRVLRVLQMKGYIAEFEYIPDGRFGKYRVKLTGRINKVAAIKPRFSVKKAEWTQYEKMYLPARDIGILIVSTNQGVMAHEEAKKLGIGGVLLAYCY